MFDKIKSKLNKKYAAISAYVIVTAVIIFILARTTFQIESIFKAAAGALQYAGKLVVPVFIGFIMAYITNPMVNFIEKMLRKIRFLKLKNDKKYRTMAVFSCILLIILVISLLLGAFIFSITKQIYNIQVDKIINIVTNYINNFSDSINSIEQKFNSLNIQSRAIEQYADQFSGTLTEWLKSFADNLVANTMNISGYISNTVLGLIIAIYMLLDKDDFIEYGNKFSKAMFSEKTDRKIKSFLMDVDHIFSGYIRGTVLDSLFMCIILSLCLSVIGIKFGVLIGILAGMCNLIPYFGPIVAFAGTIVFGVLNGQYTQVGIAIIVLIIVQQIDGNIVGPKLVGNSVSLKPIFILISVIIGAQIGGALGMVLAVPVAAIIKLFLKRNIEERLKEKELVAKHQDCE